MTSEKRPQTFSVAVLFAIVVTTALLGILYSLVIDYSEGGNSWKQGDWLIHNLAGSIRRGPFGTVLLAVTDQLAVDPLLLLTVLQGVVVTLLLLTVAAAVFYLRAPARLVLVMLSPAFIILFWFNDPQGAVRKEIMAYLAFVPILLAAMTARGRVPALISAVLIYGVAVFAHEANVFFLPFLWASMWLLFPSTWKWRPRAAALSAPALLAIAAGIYAIANPMTPHPETICLHLIERGFQESICDGAIAYLSSAPEDARVHLGRFLTTQFLAFLLIYVFCLLSLRLLFQQSREMQIWFLGVAVSGIAFMPLYILAGDYGRWLNFHMTATILVLLTYFLLNPPSWLYNKPRPLDYLAILSLNLLIGISHSPGDMYYGFILTVARALS